VKVWILNNTKIEKNKYWEDFFNLEFIPKLKKYAKSDDIVIHLGQIFNNSETVSIKLLNKIKDIFNNINNIVPLYFLDGYDTELLKLFDFNIINRPTIIKNCKFIPKNYNIIEHIDNNIDIIFINDQIDKEILYKYKQKIYCGYYDKKIEDKNIIQVGSPYQFNVDSGYGFYIVDVKTNKNKYFENHKNIKYQILKIVDIEQLNTLDKEYIEKNHISVEIDKKLINDNKLKIDVLLNDFDFKKISYINDDNEKKIDLIDNTTLKMEDLLLDEIKKTDNDLLLSEFENIMKIYKGRY